MNERDPRIDPRPGDVVGNRHVRSLAKIDGERAVFFSIIDGPQLAAIGLRYWRRWARGKEFVRR